jgi:hypothetical protein
MAMAVSARHAPGPYRADAPFIAPTPFAYAPDSPAPSPAYSPEGAPVSSPVVSPPAGAPSSYPTPYGGVTPAPAPIYGNY